MSVFGEPVVREELERRVKKLEEKLETLTRRLNKIEGKPVKEKPPDEDADSCTIT